jgi:hypothetical protein
MAERAAGDDFFLASLLLPYARAEGWGDAELSRRLGCRPPHLARLLLCRRPRPEPEAFRGDVERIAAAFRLDGARLTSVIRLAEAVRAFRSAETAGGTGWLAAARDRETTAEEPEP